MCTVCDIDMGIRESWLAFYNLYLGSGWVAGQGRLWHWWPAVSWSLWRHFNVWCLELSELSWWLLADNVDSRGEMVSQATGHWAHVSVSPPSHPDSTFHFASSPSQPQGAAVWSQQKVQITKYKMSLIMSEIFDETSDPHAAITASTESSNAVDRRPEEEYMSQCLSQSYSSAGK